MILLLAFFFLVALAALLSFANDLNTHADRQSQLLLMKALENQQENMRENLTDNAEWGEAYNNLHRQLNLHWAWEGQNLGDSMYKTFSYEGVFVISPAGKTVYSVLNGQLLLQPLEKWMGMDPLTELRPALEHTTGKAVSRLVVSGGQLTLLAAAWITPGGDSSVTLVPGPPSVMVFAQRLTTQKLNEMGREYGVHGFRMGDISSRHIATGQVGFLLPVSGGNVRLDWLSANPGRALLVWLFPLLILLMLATLALAFMLMQNTLRKARLNDESTFLLEQSKQALSASERRFRDVVETTTDWIWEMDDRLCFTWISERFSIITGCRISEWLGRPLTDFLQIGTLSASQITDLPLSGGHLTLKHCCYYSAQQYQRYCTMVVKRVQVSENKTGFRGTATDVTLEVEAQERVRYLSSHDELTGLPNRLRMKEFLEGKLRVQPTTEHPLVMIMVDLDKFKPINDLYGHTAGDKVLNEVSSRLRNCLRESDLVARHGGDEFIIVLPDVRNLEEIETLCRRIIQEINRPFDVYSNEIFIGASLGIALAPQDAHNAADLLRFSDIALYKAKSAGRNGWVFYQRDMGEKIIQRREMENELREAIRDNQLRLVYQPRYDIKTARINAVEALVRWDHPRHGLLMPDQFISLAEETGLIIALSDWVLAAACRDTHRDLPGLSVSVNISAAEFQDGALPGRIRTALETSGLESSRLEIEVTENAMLQDPEKTLEVMRHVRKMGVKFLIDDFGTGYASLNYLRTFPFDGIKLDRSFIMPMTDSPKARQIVENMIGLGKAYSMDVTAEGVETQLQLEQLKQLECDGLQGYYIGRPMTTAQIINLLS
ncbi:EAL domain-containing protein [Pantoea sp. B65]